MSASPFGPGSGTVRPLLFERLTDAGPGGDALKNSTPADTRAQVEASVAREVGALFNTRIAREVDAIEPADRTVLDYGLPDYSGMSSLSGTDRQKIARTMERAIRAFEPRLANPKVTILEDEVGSRSLDFRVAGVLAVNNVPAMHAFTLSMANASETDGE